MHILPSLNLTTLLALLLSSVNLSHAANAALAVIESKGIDASNRPFLSFSSESGESYEVHRSHDLASWQSRSTLSGSGSSLSYTDPDPLIDTRFFRVESIQTTTGNLSTGDVLTVTQSWSQETTTPQALPVAAQLGVAVCCILAEFLLFVGLVSSPRGKSAGLSARPRLCRPALVLAAPAFPRPRLCRPALVLARPRLPPPSPSTRH